MEIVKNRKRDAFTFANINLLGNCNANCYFCLGKDIAGQLRGKNQLNTHFSKWVDFGMFLDNCYNRSIKKLYITGQTADGLQYKYLHELALYLQSIGFSVGVRTNGYLATQKMNSIRTMIDEIGYSIHTLNSETNHVIMGKGEIPDWDSIIPASGDNVRISIVLNRYNVDEMYDLLDYCSSFENVKYIQVRRISTDTRQELLQEDIDIYEEFFNEFRANHRCIGSFYLAEKYLYKSKEVNFWRTVETSCNSINYFTDGTVSDEYFVVEGYLKNMKVR